MFNELANLLNDDQKAAILTTLKWIGLWVSLDSDFEGLQPRCKETLKKNSDLLKFNLSNPLLTKYEDEDAEELVFSTLNSIPTFTKPWFVVETYMMVSAQGDITPRAMQVTLMYCEKIGVSEDIYLEIIKQAYLATGDISEDILNMHFPF